MACGRTQEQLLSGATHFDSTPVALTSSSALKNFEKARVQVVIDRVGSQTAGTPPDSCGSAGIELTADIAMVNGRRFSYGGHGDSPCNAQTPGDTIEIRLQDLPMGELASIQLRSSKPIVVRAVHWESWQNGA